jgi:hypothetical protein
MDKPLDGSDAHLLPSNAELIQRLREYDLDSDAWEAADALEAADKRIAEEVQTNSDLSHLAASYLRAKQETERKLAVARKAMTKAATLECNGVIRQALAQIGGDDAGS